MATDPAYLPKADVLKVAQVCDLFLEYSSKQHAPHTYRSYLDYLQDFCERFGTLLAADLKPLHVTRWLDAHPGWKGSRRNAVFAIKRAFNWADTEGVFQPNPIKSVKKPPQRHRDRILTSEERVQILAAIPDQPFREFVWAMMETGARPGEIRQLTAGQVNLDLGVWVFKEHKTAQRTGRPRIIYLTSEILPTRSNWTAYLDNGWQGTDASAVRHLSLSLRWRAIRAVSVPHSIRKTASGQMGRYGATMLEVYAPDSNVSPFSNIRRFISAANDGGPWRFDAAGEPFEFEQVERYKERRIRDRFTPDMLDDYLRNFGIHLFDPDFYNAAEPAYLISKEGRAFRGLKEYSLAEARAHF